MNKVLAFSIIVLFGLCAWFRVSSLDSLPETDGDEAWHAIQIVHMLRGQTFSVRTEHGLPLSPIHALLELPLLLIFKPSYALLRIPSLLTGLLAVFLIYRLGSKIFDRSTGLIAALVLAVLPVAIIFSRTGYESSHAPLYGIFLLWSAYERRIVLLSALLGLCYFIHPTNIFLLPVILAAMCLRSLRPSARRESAEWRSQKQLSGCPSGLNRGRLGSRSQNPRRPNPAPCDTNPKIALILEMIAPTVIVGAVGLFTLLRPTTEHLSSTYHLGIHGTHDPLRFMLLFGRLFLGTGRTARPISDLMTWIVAAPILMAGTFAAIRQGRFDVLALLAGLIASAGGFFLVGGSDILQPGMTRYGLFLVVPTVLLLSANLRFHLIDPVGRWRSIARHAQEVLFVATAFLILLSLDPRRLTNQVLDAEPVRGESVWTFGADTKDARRLALDWVIGSVNLRPPEASGKSVIVTPDFMTRRSFQYLALSHRECKVVEFHALAKPDEIVAVMDRQLRQGAFVILPPGHPLEATIKWLLSPYPYETKEIRRGQKVAFVVYRPIVDWARVASAPPPLAR